MAVPLRVVCGKIARGDQRRTEQARSGEERRGGHDGEDEEDGEAEGLLPMQHTLEQIRHCKDLNKHIISQSL